jgi:hypothetical protein
MSKLGKFDWIFLYALAAIVDIIQLIIDFTGVGIVVSEAIEPIMGVFLIVYLQIRKFSVLQKPSVLLSLLGVAGLEVITGGMAPAWIVDIWWIQKADKKDKAYYTEQQGQEELFSNITRQPLYDSNGVRRPQIQNKNPVPPRLNIAGVRPPKGGLK